MDDRALLNLAIGNIEDDYQNGRISGAQYRKEMAYCWNYRRQLNELTTEEQS